MSRRVLWCFLVITSTIIVESCRAADGCNGCLSADSDNCWCVETQSCKSPFHGHHCSGWCLADCCSTAMLCQVCNATPGCHWCEDGGGTCTGTNDLNCKDPLEAACPPLDFGDSHSPFYAATWAVQILGHVCCFIIRRRFQDPSQKQVRTQWLAGVKAASDLWASVLITISGVTIFRLTKVYPCDDPQMDSQTIGMGYLWGAGVYIAFLVSGGLFLATPTGAKRKAYSVVHTLVVGAMTTICDIINSVPIGANCYKLGDSLMFSGTFIVSIIFFTACFLYGLSEFNKKFCRHHMPNYNENCRNGVLFLIIIGAVGAGWVFKVWIFTRMFLHHAALEVLLLNSSTFSIALTSLAHSFLHLYEYIHDVEKEGENLLHEVN